LFPEFIQKWELNQHENIFSYEPNYVKPVFFGSQQKIKERASARSFDD